MENKAYQRKESNRMEDKESRTNVGARNLPKRTLGVTLTWARLCHAWLSTDTNSDIIETIVTWQ